MNKKCYKKTALLLTLLISFYLNTQESKKTETAYAKYFNLSRKIPYLHLNKTTFLKGEEIWFKAYVLNFSTKKLDKNTTNLYCSLFDEKGKLKKQKLIYIKNGIASGSFKVDSTYSDKHYYIKASTNYMKNFREDESFQQKITVINNESTLYHKTKNNIDFQLLPEGGHLITNTYNSLGVILKDSDNNGIKIAKGELIENNKTISSFYTNDFGFAKIKFTIKQNSKYKIKVKLLDGSIITKELNSIKQKGINLHVNNLYTYQIEFVFNTNKSCLSEIINKDFYFLIHNTTSYLKRKIIFKKGLEKAIYTINRDELKAGTNIITLFNSENKPITERLFFNYKKSLFTTINTDIQIIKDSITLALTKKKDSTTYFLSASILPENTKSYTPEHSICSKFLLSPYIKGNIEKPNYYFSDVNRKKLYNLDLLLLTQGWSKYNWFNIFNKPPKEHFNFDRGITIQGTINSKLPKGTNQILFASKDNEIFEYQKIKQ